MSISDIRVKGSCLCLVDVVGFLKHLSRAHAGSLVARLVNNRSRFPYLCRVWDSERAQFAKRGPRGAAVRSTHELYGCVNELWLHCQGAEGLSSSVVHAFLAQYIKLQTAFPSTFAHLWGPNVVALRDLQPLHDSGKLPFPAHANQPDNPSHAANNQEPGVSQPAFTQDCFQPSSEELLQDVSKACSMIPGCTPPDLVNGAFTITCPISQVEQLVDCVGLYTSASFVRRTSSKVLEAKGLVLFRCKFSRKPTYAANWGATTPVDNQDVPHSSPQASSHADLKTYNRQVGSHFQTSTLTDPPCILTINKLA